MNTDSQQAKAELTLTNLLTRQSRVNHHSEKTKGSSPMNFSKKLPEAI